MKKNYFSVAMIVAASAFTAQASATTIIDLQDVPAGTTLIDNKWQDLSVILGPAFKVVHPSSPYSKGTSDGLGSITMSPIVDFNDNSHIHVGGGDGNPSTPTVPFIHGDVGGVFFDGVGSHDVFSFQSMKVNHAELQSNLPSSNATITVRGYLGGVNGMIDGIVESNGTTMKYKGGIQVAEATLLNGGTGVFNFLAADAGFGEVDYVEFFFTDFYRLKPSSLGDTDLDFEFDNVVVGESISAVPVPAAVWLFGTGIIGLVSLGKRKQAALAV